jgi:demethylmenaquinone methyltransferase/2-methoxy-6-polyprenyl-1,4-benzoquinol methylase
MATGLPDESVDAVTVSYGLRNCPDYRLGLCEIHRVLKPGGYLASLDFVRPENAAWEFAFTTSLLAVCNFYGWLWHGEPVAYGYLARSIKYFATNREYTQAMTRAGFDLVTQRPKLAGSVYVHVARKKGQA